MNRPRSRTAAIFRKELTQIVRDPRSLIIALMLPVMMLFLYGYGISSDINEIRLGVVDWSHTPESRDFIGSLTRSGYFNQVFSSDRYGNLGEAMDASRIRVGIVIPPDFARNLITGRRAPVQVLIDGSDPNTASVAQGYLSSIVQTYNSKVKLQMASGSGAGAHPTGVPPIDLRIRVWYNEELRSVNFIVPGLIAVILMATSALLTSGAIARERERGTIEQIVASPLRGYELVIGKILAYTVISFIDVVLVVLIGTLWFGAPLRGSLWLLGGCSVLFLMSSLGIGLFISSIIPTQATAMIGAVIATLMPSVLLSGFYFPIASMPAPVQIITSIVPARYFMVIVRGIFLKGSGFSDLWPQIVPLAGLGLLLMSLSVLAFRKRL